MSIAGQRCSGRLSARQPYNLAARIRVQIDMSPNSTLGPLRNAGLTFWMIAIVVAIILAWAIWQFGKRSEHPTRNNPGMYISSELIVN